MEIVSEEHVDKLSQEATVVVKSGLTSVVAFAHPYKNSVGDEITQPLHLFEVSQIVRSLGETAFVRRLGCSLEHHCCAKIMDVSSGLCDLDGIILVCEDHLPGDVRNEEFIEFSCARIDLP